MSKAKVIGVLLGVAVLALPAAASAAPKCNGFAELCGRPLNQVAFPGAHNAMSAASEPGWRGTNQLTGIRQQLTFGIRAFLIDTHYGFKNGAGVSTVNDRVKPPPGVAQGVYFCHSVCELGATDLVTGLGWYRTFLEQHPREIVILFIEDGISGADTLAAFDRAGLSKYAFRGGTTAPWPTLGQMIDSGQRLVVMAEGSGEPGSYYLPGFQVTQDTPYSFASPGKFNCLPNRGLPTSPLFLVNHWIDSFPPKLANAKNVNAFKPLWKRVNQCRQQRGKLPNIVAVDFYSSGDLLRVVNRLNGVRTPPPKRR